VAACPSGTQAECETRIVVAADCLALIWHKLITIYLCAQLVEPYEMANNVRQSSVAYSDKIG